MFLFSVITVNAESDICMHLADARVSLENVKSHVNGEGDLDPIEESTVWMDTFEECTGVRVVN